VLVDMVRIRRLAGKGAYDLTNYVGPRNG
jgi:hypothetical protein